MKVAIIGSGISGLTSAYLLNKHHEIKVFEANDYIGGHTHTHTIKMDGVDYEVDSGFIVYNENTYPNFIRLLKELNVQTQISSMGFSVTSKNNKIEYAGNSLNSVFAQRKNIFKPSFYKMLFEINRFNKESKTHLKNLDYLETLDVKRYKIASRTCLLKDPFAKETLVKKANTKKPIIVSMGMGGNKQQIVFSSILKKKIQYDYK